MADDSRGQLPIPDAVRADQRAKELVRVWAAGGQQHVAIASDAWDDAAAWGIMLVDLARLVAQSFAERHGQDASAVLTRIKEGFDAEWHAPTDAPTGHF